MPSNVLRKIPSVTEILESQPIKPLVERLSHNVVVDRVRDFLDDVRTDLGSGSGESKLPDIGELAERIARRILQVEQPRLRSVINATGVLLHTNLGRAPLAEQALEDLVEMGRDYASLEYDLKTGKRSERMASVEGLLRQLTGAGGALVVNNNAAATMLTLTALAKDKEVIVSRGQLIEIGGSYRLPDVMSASGARLREDGTTNKTRLSDYEEAIHDDTAAIMRVHTSNFVVVGFAESVSLEDLVALGHRRRLPVIDDIGSGALGDMSEFGIQGEPVARESISAGADVVLFSGDKLLGGPQCGILVGRRELVEKITRHPMTRALRVGKLTLAALAATLRLHRDPKRAAESIPLLQLLSTSSDNLKNRAERMAPQIGACAGIESAEAVEDVAYLGGGSVPLQELPTWCVAVRPITGGPDRLAAALRTGSPAVVGRIRDDRFLLDLRSVFPRADQQLVEAVSNFSQPK